jgi:signal peptidase
MTLMEDVAPDQMIDNTAAADHPPELAHQAKKRTIWQQSGRVLGTVVTVIVVMVAAIVMVVAVATRLSPKDQYTAFGHPVLIVLSGSMSPAINTGDLIVDNPVTATQATQLHVGQVITFRSAPGSTTYFNHRIYKVIHHGGAVLYETKGDANNAPDTSLRPASDVIGLYSWKIPRGGYLLSNLHDPLVLALLLAAPILWFVAEPLRRWAREEDEAGPHPLDTGDEAGAGAP